MENTTNVVPQEVLASSSIQEPSAISEKRSYRSPHLWLLGDVRDLTLGPTIGKGESGFPELYWDHS